MSKADLLSLSRVLVYGTEKTRQAAAARLLASHDVDAWAVLAGTVRSNEEWRLRARCLEALGVMAGSADEEATRVILGLLLEEAGPAAEA